MFLPSICTQLPFQDNSTLFSGKRTFYLLIDRNFAIEKKLNKCDRIDIPQEYQNL